MEFYVHLDITRNRDISHPGEHERLSLEIFRKTRVTVHRRFLRPARPAPLRQ